MFFNMFLFCLKGYSEILTLNGALVIEMVNNSFSECKKNFGRLIKRGMF